MMQPKWAFTWRQGERESPFRLYKLILQDGKYCKRFILIASLDAVAQCPFKYKSFGFINVFCTNIERFDIKP